MSRHFRHWFLVSAIVALASFSARADETNAAAKSVVIENEIAYLRIHAVGKNLADEITALQAASVSTNKIVGTVLDLRFADGDSSDAARTAADFFAAKKMPLAILVNGDTRGAADTLAADLHNAHAGLIFGSATSDLQPDIAVAVKSTDEKNFWQNPYAVTATNNDFFLVGATNDFVPFIDHTSEADLVRQKIKDGDEDEATAPTRPAPPTPVVHDPALARALDFLKALAILQPARG